MQEESNHKNDARISAVKKASMRFRNMKSVPKDNIQHKPSIKVKPKQKVSSFVKHEVKVYKSLGSHSATLLFAALEYRFNIKPDGFYKFTSPCKSFFYQIGDSLEEEISLKKKAIWKASKLICTHYKSKTIYLSALEKLGNENVFQGKPYVSYVDKVTHRTFYMRNEDIVNQIKSGAYVVDKSVDNYVNNHVDNNTEGNSPGVSQKKLTRSFQENPPMDFQRKLTNDEINVNIQDVNTVIHRLKNTLQRKPLSISLSDDPQNYAPVIEQPKEENKKEVDKENTKQPSVSLSVIDQMINSWRRIVNLDLDTSPIKATYDNLERSYLEAFSSDLTKWEEYCILCASSKYLMGETPQQFKLNLAWASKLDAIQKITNGHFTTGDRVNVIYLDLEPISDPDPIIFDFKAKCLEKMGKPRYISWIKPMGISRTVHGEIVCMAPTPWFAKHISTNDFLGFGFFIKELSISGVLIKEPSGKIVGRIGPKHAN